MENKKEKAALKREINKMKYEERIQMEKEILKEDNYRESTSRKRDSEKLYLGDIIKKENPEFGTNNLILAPTGSGKSHLIETQLIPKHVNDGDKVIYLVSTTSLKDSVCPKESNERSELVYPKEIVDEDGKLSKRNPSSLGFYTTANKESFGDVKYRVHVMTYAEFGRLIEVDDSEIGGSPLIICDEIHSAPNYRDISGDFSLVLAINYLFRKHEGRTIYYFTATREHLDKMTKKTPNQLKYVSTFDYREHPEIKKYVWRDRYVFNHLEQIRQHLRAKLKGTEYYGHKTLAFTNKITQMEQMEKIFIEEGYKPLLLWSINSDRDMTEHQIEMRRRLLNTKLVPSPYNVLIINGGMQEGWDLKDDLVRVAIINSTNETEIIQSIGRIRGDITTLVQRTNGEIEYDLAIIPGNYIEKILTAKDKEKLCDELDLKDNQGRRVGWTTVKRLAVEKGFKVEDKTRTIDGERVRVSIITRTRPVI